MPFESKAQAKWMFAHNKPMAQEWASKTKSIKALPNRVDTAAERMKKKLYTVDKSPVSKAIPQFAILKEGSARTKVQVTHLHASGKPHFGIIHPQRGQELAHRDNLIFLKGPKNAEVPSSAKNIDSSHEMGRHASRMIAAQRKLESTNPQIAAVFGRRGQKAIKEGQDLKSIGKATSLVSLKKSYVGAGAHRSIQELSPQARKVLRTNLTRAKQARANGRPMITHGPSSNTQRRIDEYRMLNSPNVSAGGGFSRDVINGRKFMSEHNDLAAKAVSHGQESGKIKNLHFHENVPQHLREAAEEHLSGKKLKHKVSIHMSDSVPEGLGGFAIGAHKGGSAIALPNNASGNNPQILRHELEHAVKGRKGRLHSLTLKTSSGRQREEAYADLGAMKGKRSAPSRYASVLGSDSVYNKTLRENQKKRGIKFKDNTLDVGRAVRTHQRIIKPLFEGTGMAATKTESHEALSPMLAPHKHGVGYPGSNPGHFNWHKNLNASDVSELRRRDTIQRKAFFNDITPVKKRPTSLPLPSNGVKAKVAVQNSNRGQSKTLGNVNKSLTIDAYDSSMEQSRFSGTSSVAYNFEAIEKAKSKKRKKNGQVVRYNPNKPFHALAQAEQAHERATLQGHTTSQTHAPVAPKPQPRTASIARNAVRPSRPVPMPATRRFLGPKPVAVGVGLAALGAYAYSRSRNNVNKASLEGARLLRGSAEDLQHLRAVPGGQGGTFEVDVKARHQRAQEAFRQMNPHLFRSKELVLAPKPGELVSQRPPAPKVKKPGTDLVRVPGVTPMPTPRGELVRGAHLVPTGGSSGARVSGKGPKSPKGVKAKAPESKSYLAAGLAAGAGGMAVGNQFSKAYDANGNPIPSSGPNNNLVAGAGVAGAGLGLKKLKVAQTLQHTAPTTAANAAAEATRHQAAEAARNSEKATAEAKLAFARSGRNIPFVRSSRVRAANKEVRSATIAASRQSTVAARSLANSAQAANVASHAPQAERALAHSGIGLIAGGTALAAAAMRNNRKSQ
jgi:hypothetical protein